MNLNHVHTVTFRFVWENSDWSTVMKNQDSFMD